MNTANTTVHKLVAALLATTLAIATGVSVAQEGEPPSPYASLPFEPKPEPSTNGKLSEGDAIKLAVDWAKFGNDPDPNKMIDAAITAITIGYPPAGMALGAAKALFGPMLSGPDPVQEALKVMDKRITALEKNMIALRDGLHAVRDHMFEQENNNRMLKLGDWIQQIADLRDDLRLLRARTPTALEKQVFVQKVKRLAARFRPQGAEADQWLWSDLHVYRDPQSKEMKTNRMDPDFKPMPMLETYSSAIVLLLAAIQYEGGDPAYVIKSYHDELMSHARWLSVRASWQDGEAAVTLPERLMNRVDCTFPGGTKFAAKDGACYTYNATCNDIIGRRSSTADTTVGTWYQEPGSICTFKVSGIKAVSEDERAQWDDDWAHLRDRAGWGSTSLAMVRERQGFTIPREEELENFNGLEWMTVLADQLVKVATTGSLKDPPPPHFDDTYWDKDYIYGITKNGELRWHGHLIGEDRNPADNTRIKVGTKWSGSGLTVDRSRATVSEATKLGAATATGVAGAERGTPFGTAANPNSAVGRAAQSNAARVAANLPKEPEYPIYHKWEGPKVVGSGWQNFRSVIPAAWTMVTTTQAAASFYAVTNDGQLLWYRHDGFVSGEPKWKGPVTVGTGWQSFTKIIPAGDGVLYAIGADGALRWYRHEDVGDPGPISLTGGATGASAKVARAATINSAPRIGTTMRAGSISDTARVTQPPPPSEVKAPSHWLGPNVVSNNWGHFVHVFSAGEGVIYGVDPQGKLWWYRHMGYLNGTQQWQGPVQVGTGWAGFTKIFSTSEGYIYALQPGGEMLWYQHQGYQNGAVRWRGPTSLGLEWGDYAFVFAAMPGTPQSAPLR